MRIAIVTSRLCDSGDQLALRRFVCCEPNGPEYAMDVQRYIRGLRVKDEPGMYRMVLQYGKPRTLPSSASASSDTTPPPRNPVVTRYRSSPPR